MQATASALSPGDLSQLLLTALNNADVEAIVRLYTENAILVLSDGGTARGHGEIRAFYAQLCKDRPQFPPGEQSAPLINGRVALTSTVLANGTVTAEVAAQQEDGTWLWAIDHPSIGRAR
jgi:ketosteroid isomerase-like protein